MSSVAREAMSDRKLRHYFLTHRDDNAPFQAYLARRRKRSRSIITAIDALDFDDKIQRLFLT